MKVKNFIAGEYDLIVVGAGHAGAEAALAGARLGLKTMILTMSLDSIVALSCNPNIGGTGKGHLVREIDALGGEMALNIDKTFIQSKMLNRSKGPAVHSLRVQADKKAYHVEMKKVLENEENLDLKQGEATDLLIEDNEIRGIATRSGAIYKTRSLVVATGTYLNGKIYMGELEMSSGPDGRAPSNILSDSLEARGFKFKRMKTGTPARIHRDSINFDLVEVQPGDEEIIPFSFLNARKKYDIEQADCYLTYTTDRMHEIIRENLYRSPMYAGEIDGIGARYCPSIEDKVVRFADKEQHQIFLEPEGLTTKEIYVQGASSTLPEEVQLEMYREIIGLENVKFMRPAYGIEYDTIDSRLLYRTLEHRFIKNLFFAGQVNGTSGYEEAAAQGLIAGINAAQNVRGGEAFILDRSEAYIGVLIDDIVTKGADEPYRIMTSRAEYRLTLRQDNADLRLTEKAYKLGLVTRERYEMMLEKKSLIEEELKRLASIQVNPNEENNSLIRSLKTSELKNPTSLYDLLKRPELSYDDLDPFDPSRPELSKEIRLYVETHIKYEGYILKQQRQIDQFRRLENKKLDGDMDYNLVTNISIEAREKLNQVKPESVGQASRISGVSPADINMLLIHLEQARRRGGKKDGEN